MLLTDQRLGEVLGRRDHRRSLSEVNPVLLELVHELASRWPRHSEDVVDAGLFLIDVLGANERGAPRIGLHTASRALAEAEWRAGPDLYRELAVATEGDVLLRMCVDALLAYSERRGRLRSAGERDAVAATLYVVLKVVRDEAEVGALERALAG